MVTIDELADQESERLAWDEPSLLEIEEWLETVLTRCEQQQKSGIYTGTVEAKQSELMIQLTEEQ
jgi:hypothetical protein